MRASVSLVAWNHTRSGRKLLSRCTESPNNAMAYGDRGAREGIFSIFTIIYNALRASCGAALLGESAPACGGRVAVVMVADLLIFRYRRSRKGGSGRSAAAASS